MCVDFKWCQSRMILREFRGLVDFLILTWNLAFPVVTCFWWVSTRIVAGNDTKGVPKSSNSMANQNMESNHEHLTAIDSYHPFSAQNSPSWSFKSIAKSYFYRLTPEKRSTWKIYDLEAVFYVFNAFVQEIVWMRSVVHLSVPSCCVSLEAREVHECSLTCLNIIARYGRLLRLRKRMKMTCKLVHL